MELGAICPPVVQCRSVYVNISVWVLYKINYFKVIKINEGNFDFDVVIAATISIHRNVYLLKFSQVISLRNDQKN